MLRKNAVQPAAQRATSTCDALLRASWTGRMSLSVAETDISKKAKLTGDGAALFQHLFSQRGKTVLVTGGGRGIGMHFATALAEAGAKVHVASRRVENCQSVVEEITAAGGTAHAHALDVSSLGAIDQFLGDLDAAGEQIDILVNNGGITWGAPTLEHTMEAWDKVFAVNVRGLFYLSQQTAKRMSERGSGGLIINVSSIAGMRGQPEGPSATVAYAASKASVIGLTRDLAIKLAPQKIRVVGLAPGMFMTDMFKYIKDKPEIVDVFRKHIPTGHEGTVDDLKATILYLCSPAMTFLTGHTLVLDGGMSAKQG